MCIQLLPKEVLLFCGCALRNHDALATKVHTFGLTLIPLCTPSQKYEDFLLLMKNLSDRAAACWKISPLLKCVLDLMHSFRSPRHFCNIISKVMKLLQWNIFSMSY
ncbi:hypothetical protein L1049_000275 [Liquidambar formosana]|uniref:Uncharacterized protein n=1 Tax=Liquidambar formosana TaxID=63359 RepID=A0AAP0NAA2_LIQFO